MVQQPRRESLHSGEHDAAPFIGKTNGVTAENPCESQVCVMYKALNHTLTFCYRGRPCAPASSPAPQQEPEP